MKTNNTIINIIRGSRGCYFGLYTKQGEKINARYIAETPAYIRVFDRNKDTMRQLSKNSVTGLRFQGNVFGAVS